MVSLLLLASSAALVGRPPVVPTHFASHPVRARAPAVSASASTAELDLVRQLSNVYTMHDAAAAGDANAVELMLLAGLPCEARNAKASTPLHLAALHGHEDVAALFLDHGATCDPVNEAGMTPLHAAASKRQLQTARLLLSRGADADAASSGGLSPIRIAAQQGDPAMLSALLEAGAVLDEESTQVAFWAAVKATEATTDDEALSADVPRLLHHIFDADMQHLQQREGKLTQNITCMQPAKEGVEGVSASLGYLFDYDALESLPLREGRRCEGGECCEGACSRITFPTFATPHETDFDTFPELEDFSFDKCGSSSTRTILLFVRLVERIRRSLALEYGLPLSSILPLQAYSRTAHAGTTSEGGGGNLGGDGLPLHADEATHASYHYSCVLYLSSQGKDFEGGTFLWNDPPDVPPAKEGAAAEAADPWAATGAEGPQEVESVKDVDADAVFDETPCAPVGKARKITPYAPTRGSAIIFSSGWENMHQVEPLTSGVRSVLPVFFTTEQVPIESLEYLGGVPDGDEGIADEMWHLLLGPLPRDPTITPRIVKELMMKWHYLIAPQHA